MLRIKKDVDLKELEKFGFEKDEEEQYMIKDLDIFVDTEEKELVLDFGFNNENIMVLYDLIQAGLVEKVEEEKKDENKNNK